MEVGGTQRRFDGEVSAHRHVRCLRCGHVADAPTGKSLRGIEKAATLDGYDVVGHRLELLGYCPRCCRKQASGPDPRA